MSAPITPTLDVLRGFVDAAIASAIAPLDTRIVQLETRISESPTTAVGATDNSGTLNQAQLAERLGVTPAAISQQRKKPSFTEWTRRKGKDGSAWCYNADTKRFHDVTDAPQIADAPTC